MSDPLEDRLRSMLTSRAAEVDEAGLPGPEAYRRRSGRRRGAPVLRSWSVALGGAAGVVLVVLAAVVGPQLLGGADDPGPAGPAPATTSWTTPPTTPPPAPSTPVPSPSVPSPSVPGLPPVQPATTAPAPQDAVPPSALPVPTAPAVSAPG
jgi:hypothetical protein